MGSRRPTGPGELRAAEEVAARLRDAGLDPAVEPFRGYSSFAAPQGAIAALALAPELLSPRWRVLRSALAAGAAAGLVLEGGLVRTPLSDALSRRRSQNVVVEIPAREEARRTLGLVCHLDTSRSGLLFDPGVGRHLTTWLSAHSLAVVAQGTEALAGGFPAGRRALAALRAGIAVGALVLAERELRGVDVPGANDNASGAAVVGELALELAAEPLASTRVVALFTGCEESGLLGTQAFLRSRDTSGWLFLNVDSVGGPGTLRFLPREGIVTKWSADPALTAIASRVSRERPELGLLPAEAPIGLTYDATPVLARGGRALTLVAEQGGVIPNYHRPTDTPENLDPAVIVRVLEASREIAAAVDRGEADPGT